jgi:hypothetical protein
VEVLCGVDAFTAVSARNGTLQLQHLMYIVLSSEVRYNRQRRGKQAQRSVRMKSKCEDQCCTKKKSFTGQSAVPL